MATRLPLVALALFAWAATPPSARSQLTIAWQNVGTDFATDANWSLGLAPANNLTANIASFAGVTTVQPNLATSRSVAGLAFTDTSVVTLTGASTLSLGASGIANTGATGVKTVSTALLLGASQSFANAGTLTVSGPVANGGFLLTLTGVGTGGTLSGVISGTGGLTKSSAGTWLLSGANTYTGPTTLTLGTLIAGTDSALGSGTLSLNGGTLSASAARTLANTVTVDANSTLGGAAALTLSGPVTLSGNRTLTVSNTALTTLSGVLGESGGSRTFTKAGTGNLLLTATSSYTGATTITGGALGLGGAGTISSANLTLGGGVLATSGTFARTLGTGADQVRWSTGGGFAAYGGALTINGFTGTPTWASTTNFLANGQALILGSTLANNVVTWTNDFSLGTAVRTITVNDNAASTADFADITGVISGGAGGGLLKNGTGTLRLSAANTYTGITSIAGGTVTVSKLADAADVGATASSLGAPTLANGTISLGSTTTAAALIYTGSGDTTNRALNLAGTSGGATLANNGTGALVFTSAFTATGAGLKTLTLSGTNTDANELRGAIVNSTAATAVTKSGTGLWILSGNNTYTGATTLSAGTLRATTNASALGMGASALNVGAATLQLANDTGLAFGRNTTVSGAATFTSDRLTAGAGVTHSFGTLSLGAFTLTTTAGANVTSGTAGLTFGATTLTGNATFSAGTGTLLTLGSITGTNRSVAFTGAGDVTLGGAVTTGTGTLTKSGAGTLTLSGANTYTGATTVTRGTLRYAIDHAIADTSAVSVNASAASTTALLDLNGFSDTLASLSFAGAAGSTANVATGAGTLTLNGNLTYTATNNPLGSTLSGNLNLGAANRTFTIGDSTAAANDLTVSAIVSGSAVGLTKAGTGTLYLDAANLYTGTTTLTAGTLKLGDDAALGTGTLSLNGGTLQSDGSTRTLTNAVILSANSNLAGSDALVFSGNVALGAAARTLTVSNSALTSFTGILSGTVGYTKAGAGTLLVSGANIYTGVTTVSAGTLRATTSTQALGTGSATVALSGGALQLANDTGLAFGRNTTVTAASTVTSDRLIAGAGVNHSLGTLSLGAVNLTTAAGANVTSGTAGLTFGATTLSATGATFTAGAGALLTLGPISGNTFGFTATGAGDTAITGVIGTTTGAVTKSGTGSLIFSAANTYTGATTVTQGTLRYAIDHAIADTSAVSVNASAAATTALLDLNGFSDTLASLTFAGGSGSTANVATGAGTLTLNGNVTYSATGNPLGSTLSGQLALGTAARTFTVGDSTAATDDLTISAAITSGVGGALVKAGAGTLLLSGANTYAGATTINTGTLKLGSSAALPTTTALTINGTTAATTTLLDLNGFNATVASLTFGGTGATATSVNHLATGSGTLTLGPSGAVTYSATNNPLGATLSGLLGLGSTTHTFNIADSTSVTGTAAELAVTADVSDSGAGALTKSGTGLLALSGNNTFTGTTTLSAGTLRATNASALGAGALSLGGGTLQLAADTGLAFGRNTTVTAASTIRADRATAGAGVTHSLGTLSIGTFALTTNAGANVTSGTAGLAFGATTLTGNATFSVGTGAQLTLGALTDGGAARTLTKSGAGTLLLSSTAASWSTAADALVVNAGTVQLGADSVFGTGTNTNLTVNATTAGTAQLDLHDFNQSAGALTLGGTGGLAGSINAVSTGTGTLTLGGNVTTVATGHATNSWTIAGQLNLGAATRTFNVADSTGITGTAAELAVTADISGAGGLTKATGLGLLQLSGNNTYTGTTTLSAGTLRATNASALGSGALALGGGTLQLVGDTALAFGRNTTVTAAATFASDRLTSGTGVTHTLGTLSVGAVTLSLAKGANITSGTAGLAFGATALSGNATFSAAADTLLTLASVTGTNRSVTVSGAGEVLVAGTFNTGTGTLTKSGAGTLTLQGASTRTGATTIGAGTLRAESTASALGTGAITLSGGDLALAGDTALAFNRAVTVSTNSSVTVDRVTTGAGTTHTLGTLSLGAQTLTVAAGAHVTSGTAGLTFGATALSGDATLATAANTAVTLGAVTESGGSRSLTKTGAGSLTFSAANTLSGTTTVADGTVTVNAGSSLGTASSALVVDSGALILNHAAQSLSSLSGSGGTIEFGTNHVLTLNQITNTSYAGTLEGVGSLVVSGGGTFTLGGGGGSSYSGSTTVSAGRFALGADHAYSGASALTLNGGALDLAGHTSSAGSLTVGAAGGTIDFGAAIGSTLALAASGSNAWTGNLTITNYQVGVDSLRFGTTVSGLTMTQLASISFTGIGVGAMIDASGFVTPSAVPEPATTAVLLGLAGLSLVAVRRRRRSPAA